MREAAIARAYLRPEMTVADVGSGTGFMAAGLAPLVSHVYVLDGSTAMLDVARGNLVALTNVAFRQTDGHILPLPDASVDAVFADVYLHHCPDPAATIREMARVLKPGGRLAITDMDAHTHEWIRAEMADEWLGFDRGQIKSWLARSRSCQRAGGLHESMLRELATAPMRGTDRRFRGGRQQTGGRRARWCKPATARLPAAWWCPAAVVAHRAPPARLSP